MDTGPAKGLPLLTGNTPYLTLKWLWIDRVQRIEDYSIMNTPESGHG